MQDKLELRLDKTKISVSDSFDNTEEKEYRHSRTPKDFKELLKLLNANGVRYIDRRFLFQVLNLKNYLKSLFVFYN